MTSNKVLAAPVSAVLSACPACARVFIERRMGCVGCAFAPFETIAEVARIYQIDPRELADSLVAAAPALEGLLP